MKYLEKIIEYGLYLFVFLLPWQTRWIWHWGELNGGYWEYGTFSLYATDVILIVILVLAAIWGIIEKSKGPHHPFCLRQKPTKSQKSKLQLKTQNIFLIILLIVGGLTIFWSNNRQLALYAWFKLLEGIVLFWLVLNVRFSRVKLAWAFVGAAVIQSVLGILQFLTQSTFSSKWLGMAYHFAGQLGDFVVETGDGRWLRAYGSLPHPNMLAGFLVVVIFVILGLWLEKNNSAIEKWFLAISYSLAVICLFFTFSRSAWLAFVIVILLYCYIVWISSRPVKLRNGTGKAASSNAPLRALLQLSVMGTILIALLTAIYWPLVSTRLDLTERLEIKSTQERMVGYQESWQLIKNNWSKGVGIGNYTLAVHNQINPNLPAWSYQPVHNIYILILSELGIIGFFIFLFFLLRITHYGLRITLNQNHLTLIYGLALLALLIIGLFDHYFWSLHFGVLLFWLILSLVAYQKSCG